MKIKFIHIELFLNVNHTFECLKIKKNWLKLNNNLEKSSITAVHRAHGRYSRLLNIDKPE
jgi:hypothetical protein